MRAFLSITKALADETRVRALMTLAQGELCLCQIVEVLGLAPSTVSKHMTLLHAAGLVERRKEGRWQFYRLAGRTASPQVRQILKWVCDHLANDSVVGADRKKLQTVRKMQLADLCACYRC